MSIRNKKITLYCLERCRHLIVHFRIFTDDVQRFNIIIIIEWPQHCRLSCTERDCRPGGLWDPNKGKVQGNSQLMFSRQRHRNAEEELPVISFHLPFPSCPLLCSSHWIAPPPHAPPNIPHTPLLTPLGLLMSFHKKKPLQKLSDTHNDKFKKKKVMLSLWSSLNFWRGFFCATHRSPSGEEGSVRM